MLGKNTKKGNASFEKATAVKTRKRKRDGKFSVSFS